MVGLGHIFTSKGKLLKEFLSGTHTGEWDLFGAKLPPTGKKTSIMMVFIWRIEDGKLAEGWEVDDNLEFLRQLGVVEYTEAGKPIEDVFR